MNFDFMNPLAFLLFLAVPVFFVFRKIGLFSRISFPLTFSDWNGYVFTWNDRFMRFASATATLLILAGFTCVIFALSDPVVHYQEKVYTSRGTDIIFVLDSSPSMAARDINGMTRIDAARLAIKNMVENNAGASCGLIARGSEAAVVVAATTDRNIFFSRLDSVVIGAMGEGTAIGTGLSSAVFHLAASKAPRKCIVLITDGENNAGEIHPETAAKLAENNGIVLYSLGIGTRGSVPLEYVDPFTGKNYSGYLDSSFDSVPLEKIAQISGGRYYGVETVSALSSSLASIAKRQDVIQSYYLKTVDTSYYDKCIFVAIAFFAAAWFVQRIVLKQFI